MTGGTPARERDNRTGVFLIRAWIHDGTLVARVTSTPDVGSVEPKILVLASGDQLRREFDDWLCQVEPGIGSNEF